ncbi:MAG: nickel insertion protein [Bacillota bacterium]
MNPEFYEYVMEKLFAAGALDVYYTPLYMKKNRPGVKLSVLVEKADLEDTANILLRETTTLGVRIIDNIRRFCLDRRIEEVETPWGKVKIKIACKNDKIINIAPEYEDCKEIAQKEGIPLKQIFDQVKNIFLNS